MVDNSCIIEGNVKFRDGKKVSLSLLSAACTVLVCHPLISTYAIRCVQRAQKNRARARALAPFSLSPCDNHASSQSRESCPRRFSIGVCYASRSFLQRRAHATLVNESHRTFLVRDKNYVMITGAVYSVYMCI